MLNPVLWLACQRARRRPFVADPSTIPQRREAQRRAAEAQLVDDPTVDSEDRLVPAEGRVVPVRLYRPADNDGPLPACVYLHAGGFWSGNQAQVELLAREYARTAQCVVVSVDYRLAPEHPFPAAPEDGYAVLQWVAAEAANLRIDPTRVAVGGASAGGGLAAAVTMMARDRGGPRPIFQLLEIPAVDLTMSEPSMSELGADYFITREELAEGVRYYAPDERDHANPYASPLQAEDLSDLPPAFVLTAEYDPLRDEGQLYARRLRQAGVRVRTAVAKGHIHGSSYADVWYLPSARRYRRMTAEALRAALHD